MGKPYTPVKAPVYFRDSSGRVTYQGVREFDGDPAESLRATGWLIEQGETQMLGWPHDRALWFQGADGGIGLGLGHASL